MTGAVRLARAIAATWPPATQRGVGPFLVPPADEGGNRVSAARLAEAGRDGTGVTPEEIAALEAAQAESGLFPRVMVFDWQGALDRLLLDAGYEVRDATDMLLGRVADIAVPPPPVTCFALWPPLAVTEEIWAESGIGPERLAVMHRVTAPRTSLLGRINDRPAGAAFVALDAPYAMLHALEVTPQARRQGLAQIMVRSAAHWAREEGAEHLAVLVTEANDPARRLYAKLGLRRLGGYHYRMKPTGRRV